MFQTKVISYVNNVNNIFLKIDFSNQNTIEHKEFIARRAYVGRWSLKLDLFTVLNSSAWS